MNHPADSMRDRRGAAERALLAALCQDSLSARARETVLQRLARHRFATPEYEVIFQAVRNLPAERFEDARERLMASLTRRGFPDLDIAIFFTTVAPAENDLLTLLEKL